jgi:hypothetical protein
MAEEYGVLIDGAVRAIARMHGDTSKLLIDCDKRIGNGRLSVFGNYATRDLKYNVQADYWMAAAVYRYYLAHPNCVEAVTVSFLEESTAEPMLLLAQIQYSSINALKEIKELCNEWDVWNLYFAWGETIPDVVHTYENIDGGRIESAKLIAVPLFSIASIEQVVALRNRLPALAPWP